MNAPAWAREIRRKYKSAVANSFIVTGNIGDFVDGRLLFKWYLYNYLVQDMNLSQVFEYNMASGCKTVAGDGVINGDFSNFCAQMSKPGRNGFVITYPEFLLPENGTEEVICLHEALNSDKFLSSDNVVILLSESARNINSMFLSSNSKTVLIDVPLPNYNERLEFINTIFEQEQDSDAKAFSATRMNITPEAFANISAGLTLSNIDDIIMTAIARKELSRDMVVERKKELIRKEFGEIIEIMDTEGLSLDKFAGQDHLKQYFKDVIIDAIEYGDTDIIPKGVLLMGPPGTGKTYFCRCLAGDAGINFVEFKMSKILGKYVGESEKRMEKALSVFRALAPVGVFMDEVDQSVGRGGEEGHSVNKNLFGMLLAEMSRPENRGRIIWLGATNFPNNIDEALKRPGRFDKKVAFFAPNTEDRKNVFKIHLKNKNPASDIDYDFLAKATEGFTQAEIEGIVLKAVELAHRDKENKDNILENKYLELALKYISHTNNVKIQQMVNIALREVNDMEFVPEEYKDLYNKVNEMEELEDPEDAQVADDALEMLKGHLVNKKKRL